MDTMHTVEMYRRASDGAFDLLMMTAASAALLFVLPDRLRRIGTDFAIYTHETCHGVMSLLTGGEFHRFHVGAWGGVAVTSGGNRKAITAAGYVGTLLIGAMLIAASAQSENVLVLLRIVVVLLALSTLKAGDLYTAMVGAGVARIAAISTTLTLAPAAPRLVLSLLGVLLIWEGLRALKTLLALSATVSGTNSDAEVLARLTGRSPMHWAVVLGGIGVVSVLVIIGFVVRQV